MEVEYGLAVEYDGPPLPVRFQMPRAHPVNVDTIHFPVASILSHFPNPNPNPIPLPVVQPLKHLLSPTSVLDSQPLPISPTLPQPQPQPQPQAQPQAQSESPDWSGLINSSLDPASSSSPSHDNNHSRDFLPTTLDSPQLPHLSPVSASSLPNPPFHNTLHPPPLTNDHPQWTSSNSLDYLSSSVRTGECKSMPHPDIHRPPLTFRHFDSFGDVVDLFTCAQPPSLRPKKHPPPRSKKGACYRCLKGNRFTEKEVCIVCNAKYCTGCVLRAMGSMPEGRKCVTCIGYSIDESRRVYLGKCSRMLKRLLNDLEIRQIMKAEKLCDANQLPPEYISVNGKPLCHDELLFLHTCSNPPKNLKPGIYWYDKVSGMWGKEGEKPSQIISPHLNVGDPIKPDASNGDTQVFINGREITKPELRMLQLAGVQCAGNPHFWVNDDGSYQEEGQKNTKGFIWDKPGMKLVCALLSLPVPSNSKNPCTQEVNYSMERPIPDYLGDRGLQKVLLVGYNGAGTSTLFKQARILYRASPFSDDEKERIKLMIQGNVYGYLGVLLEGRERFEDESVWPSDNLHQQELTAHGENDTTVYSICPRLKEFSDWLLKIMASGSLETIFPAATREYSPLVKELWNTEAIQATYRQMKELELLPSVASYFLERADDVLQPDYEPSDLDILYAEGVTSSNGLACTEFSFPKSAVDDIDTSDEHGSLPRYQLIRVQARGFAENCKWLEMLEDVRLVIFCVSLSDYDQYSYSDEGAPVNKMLLSKKLFESLVTHPTFEQMDFLLMLNKFDLFEEKIERVPLSECEWFEDFQPVISQNSNGNFSSRSKSINHNPSVGHLGFHHIAVKFKRLFSDLTGRKLFACSVKGMEPDSVDAAFKYAREIIKWDDEKFNFSLSQYSVYSTEMETSYSSH